MKITEVRIKLMDDGDDRLRAFCSITMDDSFVVRDLKIIDGSSGPFVAMPSRKLTAHCPKCRCKNHLRAAYCNQCGGKLREPQATKDSDGRAKLYADIAHPINSECREMIQRSVIAAYEEELELASQPGYVSRYDDYLDYEETDGAARTVVKERRFDDEASTPKGPHSGRPEEHELNDAGSSQNLNPKDDDGFGAGIF